MDLIEYLTANGCDFDMAVTIAEMYH